MTTTDHLPANLPGYVQKALTQVVSQCPDAGAVGTAEVLVALHRAKLLAGDRDCSCNRSEDGQRDVVHQRGDEAFCRDVFDPVVPDPS